VLASLRRSHLNRDLIPCSIMLNTYSSLSNFSFQKSNLAWTPQTACPRKPEQLARGVLPSRCWGKAFDKQAVQRTHLALLPRVCLPEEYCNRPPLVPISNVEMSNLPMGAAPAQSTTLTVPSLLTKGTCTAARETGALDLSCK
jgi:hypothetical protein